MRNIKLTLQYDGSNYFGWQIQNDQPTVQAEVEAALSRITNAPVRTIASGRTDAGTHALGQVVNFKTHSRIDSSSLVPAMNSLLPDDIAVRKAEDVPLEFHSRYSALSKIYRYLILNRREPSPFYRNYAWHIPYFIDLEKMASALTHFQGKKDYSSFRAASSSDRNPVRNIITAHLNREGDFIKFTLEAESFLRHMVRIIIGTLVEVGREKLKPQDIKEILEARNRTAAGPTATARGLYLVKVKY
jgi:tRNA pseudouridine38-40 synthase